MNGEECRGEAVVQSCRHTSAMVPIFQGSASAKWPLATPGERGCTVINPGPEGLP